MPLETTYTVTGRKDGTITFTFDLNGDLILFKYQGDLLTDKQRKWMYPRIPVQQDQIKNWMAIKEFTVTKGEPDISFEAFWLTYGEKSKKIRSQKLYKALSDTEKFNAIAGIKRYNNWLRRQNGINRMLPDTYLYQKRWLDEF